MFLIRAWVMWHCMGWHVTWFMPPCWQRHRYPLSGRSSSNLYARIMKPTRASFIQVVSEKLPLLADVSEVNAEVSSVRHSYLTSPLTSWGWVVQPGADHAVSLQGDTDPCQAIPLTSTLNWWNHSLTGDGKLEISHSHILNSSTS